MPDDQNVSSEPIPETSARAMDSVSDPVEPESSQTTASTAIDMLPEAPESPTNDSIITPVKDQNGGVNEPESDTPEPSKESEISQSNQVQPESNPEPVQSVPTESAPTAPAPLTPQAPQSQSPAQQDQTGFIRTLLAKAQAKIQSNKQKKLDKIILFAQKKKIIANEDVQKLLRVSDATATRYLVKLVQQGRLARVGNPRDAKYQFLH